ncbi:SDR family oxidoreductase [Thiohalocapsa marina]|uniref:SDR family oxidoreductase n=1 Tax=Thiohalocapsa marina TaxID=424902 RepID=A0A5M8FJM9_9GAMM|nr:oxidoreductase [Thiohalocapsa marina]KAA6183926.1 SDR family oxidoreductase [Thiohalocapsa marina]
MLKDKVVLITGAAGRIGASAARGVIAHGGSVALVDVNAEGLDALQADLPAECVLSSLADAGQPEEADRCIAEAVARFGRVDAAIHSAYPRSKGWGTAFEDLQPEFLSEDLSRHLGGAILFSQRMLRHFKQQGHGNLIHVSSIQGVAAPKFEHYAGTKMVSPIEYSAIKAGLIAMTRYLAKYYKGNHIRVNCISPGGILDNQPKTFLDQYRASCNDKGMLESEDVVGTLLFLISEHSRFITGQNIIVDDGWSL